MTGQLRLDQVLSLKGPHIGTVKGHCKPERHRVSTDEEENEKSWRQFMIPKYAALSPVQTSRQGQSGDRAYQQRLQNLTWSLRKDKDLSRTSTSIRVNASTAALVSVPGTRY